MHSPSDSELSLVVRTDFSDQAAWDWLRAEIVKPVGIEGFLAYVEFVDDRDYESATPEQLVAHFARDARPFVIVADSVAITHPEHLLLVLDLIGMPGRTFRAPPGQIQGIENNLSIANMDFEDFASCTDDAGVFRGFPGE
jgi:hypothetical protein